MQFSRLDLKERIHRQGRVTCHFRDFVIDGNSLRDLLERSDEIGVFGNWHFDYEQLAAHRLILNRKSELPSGRVPLYVCPLCGDLDCGAIAVRVEETDEAFVWSDFATEVTY